MNSLLLAAFALFVTLKVSAHAPDCPAEREAGDACRDLARHADHPHASTCPEDDGPARNACLADAEKRWSGEHPAIWRCAAEEEEWRDLCELYVRSGRQIGYLIADCAPAYMVEAFVTPLWVPDSGGAPYRLAGHLASGLIQAVQRERECTESARDQEP